MSLGLKRGIVQLEPHDKQWDEAAIQTIKIFKSILGDDAIDIQHIGSTAIPAIKAKPIIDIAVGVTDFEKIMSYNEQLQKEGIFYRGSDVEDQILYVMGDMEKDIRTHHIHIVKWNGTEWKKYIHFRDYLNDNENMALRYQRVKEELESKYADNRGLYTKGKKDIIKIDADIDIDLDVIGYVDPSVTVNVIRNGEIVEKKKISAPEKLTNVLFCKNPRCITSTEADLDHVFRLTDPETKTYSCVYCDTKQN